jgi:hypothetical protein
MTSRVLREGDRVVVCGNHGMAGMRAVVERVSTGKPGYALVRFLHPSWANCSPYVVIVGHLQEIDIIESLIELG